MSLLIDPYIIDLHCCRSKIGIDCAAEIPTHRYIQDKEEVEIKRCCCRICKGIKQLVIDIKTDHIGIPYYRIIMKCGGSGIDHCGAAAAIGTGMAGIMQCRKYFILLVAYVFHNINFTTAGPWMPLSPSLLQAYNANATSVAARNLLKLTFITIGI